jgi:hypothetical protein
MTKFIGPCLALAAAGFLFVSIPGGEASAQTATNLNCKGCVGKKDIGKKAVTKRAIKKNSIKTTAIKNGAVTADKLADGAKPSGAAYQALDNGATNLTNTEEVIASVNLNAPANGLVVVLAHATLQFAAQELAYCSIGPDGSFDAGSSITKTGDNSIPNRFTPISTSRVFPVSSGPGTYNLVCYTDSGAAVQIQNTKLTALYVPQDY